MKHLAGILRDTARTHPDKPGTRAKRSGVWTDATWSETWQSVLKTAYLLNRLGVVPGDRIAIWSENRPEWLWFDMASLTLEAASVPIYMTLSPSAIRHILEDSRSRVLVVSTPELLNKIEPLLGALSSLEHIVLIEGEGPQSPYIRQRITNLGDSFTDAPSDFRLKIEAAVSEDRRSSLATIIYTSGTTGSPKGVMLTHGNFLANIEGVKKALSLDPSDVHLSFLPLSHVFERLGGYYLNVERGGTIAYAENMDTVPENIIETRPTMLLAVPRFYEKILLKIRERVKSMPPLNRRIFSWAEKVGTRASRRRECGAPLGLALAASWTLAKLLVAAKIKRQLGGRLRFCVSGGAPLPEAIARFFHAMDILILEGYGLTETSPVIACNRPDAYRFGTVGRALEGVEVRIADDGEILTKSPSVMRGYYGMDEATHAVLRDGWFATGDLGKIEDGFLRITGRKKEIIVTSGGKKISPAIVEAVYEEQPVIQRCVLFGDGRNFLTGLIVPNFEVLKEIARVKGLRVETPADFIKAEWVARILNDAVRTVDAKLSPYEQIKHFALLERDFLLSEGELTPTLKPRRSIILAKYRHLLEPFYRAVP